MGLITLPTSCVGLLWDLKSCANQEKGMVDLCFVVCGVGVTLCLSLLVIFLPIFSNWNTKEARPFILHANH